MNIKELDEFRSTPAINFNNDLNPQLFINDMMRPLVQHKLMSIAQHFREFLGIQDIALVDIELSGSNAAYSYTPHSDVDLHLIVDFSQLPDSDIYRELFNAKQYQYNSQHNLKIKSYDVELYVQDAAQPHHSLGSYSVMTNSWNRVPTKERANLDDAATILKYQKLKDLAIRALASDNEKYLNDVLDMVKKYRQAGLDKHGEFGPENLAFKMLRTDGYFAKLWKKKRSHTDRNLSLETKVKEPDTLAQEFMAEFNGESTTQQTEGMIKQMAGARANLFDDFDYDYVYEAASKLVTFEAAYHGNLGFMEVMQFYKEASKDMVDLFNRLVAAEKNKEAWAMIQKFTNTKLVGQQFNKNIRNDEELMFCERTEFGLTYHPMKHAAYKYRTKDAPLSESLDSKIQNRIDNFLNIDFGITPSVGDNVYICGLMFAFDAVNKKPFLLIKGVSAPAKVLKIIKNNATGFECTVRTATGIIEEYPKYFENAKTCFFAERDEFTRYLTAAYTWFSDIDKNDQLNEDGRIVKNVNTTQDVDVDEIKVQAKKMGFNVDIGGIPEIPKNGVPKLFEGKEVETVSVWDMHGEFIREYYRNNKQLLKSLDNYNKASGFLDSYRIIPVINNNYIYASAIITPAGLISVKAFTLPQKLTNYEAGFAYFETQTGIKQYPANDTELNDVLFTPLFFKNNNEYNQFKTAAALVAGDWDIVYRNFSMVAISESTLTELNMAPGRLQKEVNRILQSAKPNIGIEFEVIIPRDSEAKPDITKFTTYDDIEDFDEEVAYQVANELEELVGEGVSVESGDSYGDLDTSKNWVVTSDRSVKPTTEGDAAIEIITPKMEYLEGIEQITKVFDYLVKKDAYANDSTGIHINVSLDNVDHSKLNYPKLIVMLGDAHIMKQYGREFNEYTENALNNLGNMMNANMGYPRDKEQTAKSYAAMLGKLKGDFNNAVASSFDNVSFGKFNSVGIKDDYIEFRAGGGANYLDEIGDIVDMINRFVISYVVACDPEAYKNEYGKKLYKLVSNLGSEQVPTNSIALFAKFSSGMLTKDDLIRMLNAKQSEKDKPEVDDTGILADTSNPEVINDAIEQLSFDWSIPVSDARAIWDEGMAVEMERFSDSSALLRQRRAAKETFNNLKDDIGHYKR